MGSVYSKGLSYSAADRAAAGYGQYQQPPSATSKNTTVAYKTPETGIKVLRAYNDPMPTSIVAEAGRLSRDPTVIGMKFRQPADMRGVNWPQRSTFASKIDGPVYGAVAPRQMAAAPLRSATGTYFAPQQPPKQMLRQATGSYFPPSGPTAGMQSLAKINTGLGRFKTSLADAGMFGSQSADLGPNYNPDDGMQRGPETMPDPTSGLPPQSGAGMYGDAGQPWNAPAGTPPSRASLIGDDEGSFISPKTMGKGAGGLIGGVLGGPVGGLIGSKLGGFAVDKAREYGHPLYGYGTGNGNRDESGNLLSGLGGGGNSGLIDPQLLEQQREKAKADAAKVDAAKANAASPINSYLYPQYTQSAWAPLPRGSYGR
jgi:hypothetical protein